MEKETWFVIQQKRNGFWYDYSSFPDGTKQEEMDAWVAASQHAPNFPGKPGYANRDYRVVRRTDEFVKEYPAKREG